MYRVLLADDEIWVLNGLMNKVNWADYRMEICATATDGIEAARLAAEHKPHLIFTDLRMPGRDGLSLIETVRQSQPDVLFVILTGYDLFDYAQKALRLGVLDYLVKPLSPESIQEVLLLAGQALQRTHGGEAGAEGELPVAAGEALAHSKVAAVRQHLQDYYQKDLSQAEIAQLFGLSPSYLSDVFRRTTGTTLMQYLSALRIEKAKQLLRYTDYTVDVVWQRTGFRDYHHFVRTFKRLCGQSPTAYRAGDEGGESR